MERGKNESDKFMVAYIAEEVHRPHFLSSDGLCQLPGCPAE